MSHLRWQMIALCFVANIINFLDRSNLAVAVPHIQADLHLSPAMTGLALSGFFWTYALMQIPVGWMIDRFGVRKCLAGSVFWWSLFTATTSFVSGLPSLLGARLMLGVGEAGALPGFAKVAFNWFPRTERALASSIFDSGSRVGSALALPVVAWLVATVGWRQSFIWTGTLGIVWVGVWLLLYRDPAEHPKMTPQARAALAQSQTSHQEFNTTPPVTLRQLLRYRTIWGMMFGFFCLNFAIYFFITWFPSYLIQARHFSLDDIKTYGMIPALIAIPFGWIGGFVSDRMIRHGFTATQARKTCLVGGMLVSCVIAFAPLTNSTFAALALMAISYSALAFTAANVWSLPGEVSPSPGNVASIGALQNCAANLAGIGISTFTGVMLTITHGSFIIPLGLAGALCILGALSYLFVVGKLEPLPAPTQG
ncbi:MFS transporter [Kozakia baliensis]|uniref:MFS transporter n=1 Tax=Kozakia baliensis TaxID=153496 RepID=A0A1D8UQJ2_9PROT|nr:MFS transporter [Kozakia baliensis]AOX15901.1 MFS transporter [Kozakia baliensis]GBR27608.1 major facilitator superfamily transporter [Kozakia baliensis NRIC 0488]GEL64217.1 MFS transporter [Kozakia baliensis]